MQLPGFLLVFSDEDSQAFEHAPFLEVEVVRAATAVGSGLLISKYLERKSWCSALLAGACPAPGRRRLQLRLCWRRRL